MEEKRADNVVINNGLGNNNNENRNYINNIDSQIDVEKSKMKNLDDMEEIFISLNKNISKCVELLNKSIKGKSVSKKLNAIEENNKINFVKSMNNIDSEREEIKNNLIKLNKEKEEYQDKMNKKEDEEEDNNNEG